MARKKVNLAWISNDSTRRATFKKRRKGLMKKASELATLCDVRACVVVYAPGEAQAEVWPSPAEAARVLARFKSMPEMEQCKKMMNQEGFLRQRVAKAQEQLRKQERENRELETTLLMYDGLNSVAEGAGAGAVGRLRDLGIEDATSLAWMVEMKAKAVQERIDILKAQMHHAPSAAAGAATSSSSHAAAAIQQHQGPTDALVTKDKTPLEAAMEALQRQNWFMEVMNPSIDNNVLFGGVSGPAEEMMLMQPYIETTMPWLDPYFPLN
ncbi:agamous-like MADS-box protein AGL80 [Ananas comosus]|uniref:Agamous-like MADS-box protein AGL80 n=1 Tax=Ananas comosus TaxID=4615 RepID=A0A199V9M7_ANACO|nr:agamous-like MADS-box protein AGL80 [Ananas comosus]OAY73581.1 Agamous-like MADS-box protein AGL80 [Ananas comosus]